MFNFVLRNFLSFFMVSAVRISGRLAKNFLFSLRSSVSHLHHNCMQTCYEYLCLSHSQHTYKHFNLIKSRTEFVLSTSFSFHIQTLSYMLKRNSVTLGNEIAVGQKIFSPITAALFGSVFSDL